VGVRKNAENLTPSELVDLREAFEAWYQVEDDRGFGFFAGIHGLPLPVYCEHGTALFLPWHRAYLYHVERALTAALRQHVSLTALRSFALVTRLGDTSTLTVLGIVVAALLLIASQRRLAVLWVLAVGGNSVLNVLLKGTFERVRPVHEHDLLVTHSGWSFPSGHSSGSVVAYGMLAYVLVHLVAPRWQLPLLLLATLVALTVGFSRVFLQVHYFSDVLAGFASGLIWLTICIVSSEWLRLRRSITHPG